MGNVVEVLSLLKRLIYTDMCLCYTESRNTFALRLSTATSCYFWNSTAHVFPRLPTDNRTSVTYIADASLDSTLVNTHAFWNNSLERTRKVDDVRSLERCHFIVLRRPSNFVIHDKSSNTKFYCIIIETTIKNHRDWQTSLDVKSREKGDLVKFSH